MGELTIETIVPTGLIVGLLVGSFDCQFRIPVNANFYSKRDPQWRIMRSLIVGTYHRNGISHWHDFRPFGKFVWLLVQNPCKCKILVEMRSSIVETYHRTGISYRRDFRPFGKLVWLLVQNPCKCKILVEMRSSLENYEILNCRNLPSKRYFLPA